MDGHAGLQSSPTPRSCRKVAYSRPSTARTKFSGKNYAVSCGLLCATERHFRALPDNASPHARPTRPTRAHYLGYIMRVIRYGPGYAGGILGGAIHPEMGRRNGALSTHLDFPMRLSHEPGLWIYYKYQYGDVRATLSWHVRAAARPRHARADDTTTTHTTALSAAQRVPAPDLCWIAEPRRV